MKLLNFCQNYRYYAMRNACGQQVMFAFSGTPTICLPETEAQKLWKHELDELEILTHICDAIEAEKP